MAVIFQRLARAKAITAPIETAAVLTAAECDYEGLCGGKSVHHLASREEAAFMVRDVQDLRTPNLPGIAGGDGPPACG